VKIRKEDYKPEKMLNLISGLKEKRGSGLPLFSFNQDTKYVI